MSNKQAKKVTGQFQINHTFPNNVISQIAIGNQVFPNPATYPLDCYQSIPFHCLLTVEDQDYQNLESQQIQFQYSELNDHWNRTIVSIPVHSELTKYQKAKIYGKKRNYYEGIISYYFQKQNYPLTVYVQQTNGQIQEIQIYADHQLIASETWSSPIFQKTYSFDQEIQILEIKIFGFRSVPSIQIQSKIIPTINPEQTQQIQLVL